jgi:uncharacterized protein
VIAFDIATPWHLLAFCAAACTAGFVRGFAGFAGPATVSLLLTQLFSPTLLLPKIILLDVYAYPMLLRNLEHRARWRISIPMAVATVLLIPAGVHAMQVAEPQVLKRAIGVACLCAIGMSLTGYRFKRLPPWWANLLAALVLGFVLSATFIALPIVTYFLLLPLSPAVCRATVLSFSVMVMPFFVGWLTHRGVISFADAPPVALAGIIYFSMIYLGAKAFERSQGQSYRPFVQLLLAVLSVAALA